MKSVIWNLKRFRVADFLLLLQKGVEKITYFNYPIDIV